MSPESDSTGAIVGPNQPENPAANSSMKRVGEIVENSPEEALTVVRGWLHGEQ
jgi:flagellar biosynthesis/type III secretory pathway M-ring protein FliF/YscJ